MSLRDLFVCGYPRSSPISPAFKVGACVHGESRPELFELAATHGLDHVLMDFVSEAHADAIYANAHAVGLMVLAGSEHFTGRPAYQGDVLLTVNEPNSERFWREGVAALVESYRKLKAIAGERPVIGGNLSWLSRQEPERWVRDLARLDAGRYFDFIGLHCYEGGGSSTAARAEDILALYRSHGFRQPAWVSEFGFNRNNASDEKVARWTVYAMSRWSQTPSIQGATVYELFNEDRWGFSMLEEKTGRPRPVLTRIRKARAGGDA